MFVKNLKLKNFRSYQELDISFCDGINLIYGNNGQGKTNIIEAIYMFASARSHRTIKEKELVLHNKDYCQAKIGFENSNRDMKSEISIFKNKKREIKLNDIKIDRNSELMGSFNAVLFCPEDLGLIKNGPLERRRFMDIAISQIKPNYFRLLIDYNRIIKQKNRILKEGGKYLDLLDIWNDRLISAATKIIMYRKEFIDEISEICGNIHYDISNQNEELKMEYLPCVCTDDIVKNLEKKLVRCKNKEIFDKVACIGPHREDISFYINQKKVKEFASQGQQRTVILTLKLAQCEYIKNYTGEYPVLLLDDILSELDSNRQKYLLNQIKNKQVIITAVEKRYLSRIRKNKKVFYVENSKIYEQ